MGEHCPGCVGYIEPHYLARKDCPGLAANPAPAGLDDRLVSALTRWIGQSGWVTDYEHARAEAEGFVSHYTAARLANTKESDGG